MLFNREFRTRSIAAAALLAVTASPCAAQSAAPDADVPAVAVIDYDEAGYARWPADATSPTAPAAAIWVTHATLPADSFVEVTRIDTGRTILARVARQGSSALVNLSAGAASLLKLDAEGQTAVRVRRVNPPEQEKAALRAGKPASERIDTPDMLLTVLRKKVGPPPALPPVAKPPIDLEPVQPAVPVAVAKPEKAPPAVEAKPAAALKPAPAPKPEPKVKAVTTSGSWFVQVAALSNRAKADQLAKQLGGTVQPSGSLFRVRTGPYANEGAARTALGPIAAKGYRDARITR